ncbi:MAG: serine/threonine protein kinase [Planctomycetaceae bacterium]
MDIDARYEFLEKVGSGSFATVYRARDNELGREVAIKQIHQQYLDEPRQLDRYWQEAQLLASLQHPNIVTIFDIYRDRGWLILELMQSNLAERMAGRQMDLRSLRTTIAHCLRALKYLHSRGIIHGDVKPGNMMIDARRRVKLGDFGLARRVSDGDGSLLKGTTKYMAPEVVSDEFGDIGPSSDLYSLGFASYELMCGPNFESLFPGLSAFGRNKQVAWMMWHAAADRKLPEISRVLEGVPQDVSHVVEKLTQKDQSQRYDSADRALSDLKIDLKLVDKGEPDLADEPAGLDPKRRKRLMFAAGAFVASVIVCLVIFFLPKNANPSPKVNAWFITGVNVKDRVLTVVEDVDRPDRRESDVQVGRDARISLEIGGEVEPAVLRKLQTGDRIQIGFINDEGKSVMKINAARPYLSGGIVETVDVQKRVLTMVIDDGDGQGTLPLRIPEGLKVVLNLDRAEWDRAKPGDERDRLKRRHRFRIEDVRAKDRLEAFHLPELGKKHGRVLTGVLFVHRIQGVAGAFVTEVNAPAGRLTVALPDKSLNLPLRKNCGITLSQPGKPPQPVQLGDLKNGDVVSLTYDTMFCMIDAVRGEGRVEDVIDLIRASKKEIVVRNKTITLTDATRVHVLGKPASLTDLHPADLVVVLLTKPFADANTAVSVTVIGRRRR